jgi:hypothetical protein
MPILNTQTVPAARAAQAVAQPLLFRAKRELFSIARFLRDEICFFLIGEATP